MLREKTVFGPIRSRRLGNSLGINLLPENGKICNFDCIYCECGWNSDGREDRTLPGPEDLRSALEKKLSECRDAGIAIDSITFSGDGEPTLNPAFPQMVDITLELRDRFFPQAAVSVLSNATTAGRPEIFRALCKVDNAIMKIDAADNGSVRLVNRPVAGYDLEQVISSLEAFKGNFILQTMFLRGGGFDSSDTGNLQGWMSIVRRLHPRRIMVYTIDRPAPMSGLEKFTEEQMRAMVAPLIEEGFDIQIKG
ncbi:MAG: radical SAM protein [Bacteroidales bacterium]|nr:radical SAM protein [Bacteroidales bacterium]